MSPIDLEWRNQWTSSSMMIHSLVQEKNRILRNLKKKTQLLSFHIDAVPVDILKNSSGFDGKSFIITEQSVTDVSSDVKIFNLPTSFYGIYHSEHEVSSASTITKDFNCFINRIDPIRQTWFYLLYTNGLLDRGHVSFNLALRQNLWYPESSPKKVFDRYHDLYLSSFGNIKSDLDKIVPYKSFDDDSLDLFSISAQSKFSIVIETYFDRIDAKVLSEKIFRALQVPRPWMLFAATGCVQKLRDMGFDVFDDIVDHSYNEIDTSINANPVIDAIIDQSKSLVDLQMTPALIERLSQGCQHNRKILSQWNQYWSDESLSVIDDAFEQAMLE